ncbi:sugar phosphate isomerase/epimerase [Candidatus Aerophobetes bacterium]|nr:sugar phosphate isomerase/epimerase [Candidatus Aerophobetes bacterium]
MKIGLAIAPEHATPLAFVVFREDLDIAIKKARKFGYDGIELALADPREINVAKIKALIEKYDMELIVISTGRVFSEGHLWFTHPEKDVRDKAVQRMKDIIELASQFKANVNVGRVRGDIPKGESREETEERFSSAMIECSDFAASYDVQLLLEPVNRYETNFINSLKEGMEIVRKLNRENIKLMPDTFHMNIEDASIIGSLKEAKDKIGYVHFADSNRWAPGQGHLNFFQIVATLKNIGYDGYLTVEILPEPNPDTAARMAIDFLRRMI